jgi:hypothetical protein
LAPEKPARAARNCKPLTSRWGCWPAAIQQAKGTSAVADVVAVLQILLALEKAIQAWLVEKQSKKSTNNQFRKQKVNLLLTAALDFYTLVAYDGLYSNANQFAKENRQGCVEL